MLFNSYIFWAFFAVVLFVYRRLHHRAQNRWLLLASYVFYGFWDWRFLSLILISTLVDFSAAQAIRSSAAKASTGSTKPTGPTEPKGPATSRGAKRWLWLSVCTNLGLLAVFKYYGFFAAELSVMLKTIGLPIALPTLSIALPVGISFYTFQTMSYTIDVYKGKIAPSDDLWDFALFVCFFPQLVAGPVERTDRLMPQIANPRTYDDNSFSIGLYHIVIGLFKKVVIADNMAPFVNAVFETPAGELSGLDCLIGVYAFAFQIYGDFSGYSSLAQGIAKWLGFDLMTNFRMPYFAVSPSDFWQRWHISLSQWLRDYLYIPLGGNRHGSFHTQRNLMITMILGGLWHGANWTFLAWGAFHGLLLCGYRFAANGRNGRNGTGDPAKHSDVIPNPPQTLSKIRRCVSAIVMFHFVCIGWLFFRSDSIEQAFQFATRIALDWSASPSALSGLAMLVFFAGPLLMYEAWVERHGDILAITKHHWLWRACVYSYAALMILFFTSMASHEFIYFQF